MGSALKLCGKRESTYLCMQVCVTNLFFFLALRNVIWHSRDNELQNFKPLKSFSGISNTKNNLNVKIFSTAYIFKYRYFQKKKLYEIAAVTVKRGKILRYINRSLRKCMNMQKAMLIHCFIVTKIWCAQKLQPTYISKWWHCGNITCKNTHVYSYHYTLLNGR